jgi:hypothetical protein
MALWIRTNPDGATAEPVLPANGATFTLEEMQRMVGGHIEALRLGDGTILWLNEEGKLYGLPFNPIANELAHLGSDIALDDYVVGNAILATAEESGENDEADE